MRLRLSVAQLGVRTNATRRTKSRQYRYDAPIDEAVSSTGMRRSEEVDKVSHRCHRLGIWIAGVPRKEWSGEMKQYLSVTAQRQCDAGEMIGECGSEVGVRFII